MAHPSKTAGRTLSIRAQLYGLAMAIVAAFAGLVAWYSVHEWEHAERHAEERVAYLASTTADRVELLLDDIESHFVRMAGRSLTAALDSTRCDPFLQDAAEMHKEYARIVVISADGRLICPAVQAVVGPDTHAAYDWFRQATKAGRFRASGPIRDPLSDRWISMVTQPLRDEMGDVAGLVAAPLDLEEFKARLFSTELGSALVVLTDSDGTIIARSRNHGERVGKRVPDRFNGVLGSGTAPSHFGERGIDGVERLYVRKEIPRTGWLVFAALPADEIYSQFRRIVVFGAVVVISFLAVLLAVAWRARRTVVEPVAALAAVSARVAHGDTRARAPVDGPIEVRAVATEFNRMLDSLERQRNERAALVGHYEHLVHAARDIILLMDPDGRIVEANQAAVDAYGYAMDELRALHILDLRIPEDGELLRRQLEAADSAAGVLFEAVHRRKDGSIFPVEVSSRRLVIDGKSYRQSFVRDISERRKAEEERLAAESRFRTAIEAAPEGIFIQVRGHFAYVNPEAVRIFGATCAQDLNGRPVIDRIHPDFREQVRERIRTLNVSRRAVASVEEAILRLDGSRLDVEISAVPFEYGGEPGALAFMRDITERRKSAEDLRKSEHRFRTLIEDVPNIAVQGYDRERRVVFWNAASESLYGYARSEALGQRLEDLIIPQEMRAGVVEAVTRWAGGGEPIPAGELVLRNKDGSPVSVFSSHALLTNAAGGAEMYCIDVDLTPLQKAREETADWRNRYEAAILASGQIIQEWDPDSNALSIMGDTERVLGYSTAELNADLGRWRELIHPDDREGFEREITRATSTGTPFHQEYRVRRKDGAWLTMQDDGYMVRDPSGHVQRMVCFIANITERTIAARRIAEQLDELRRWHSAMLGREARILELKREVNELLAAAGQSPKYGVAANGDKESKA